VADCYFVALISLDHSALGGGRSLSYGLAEGREKEPDFADGLKEEDVRLVVES